MADLRRLQLLVDPERADPREEADRLQARVDEDPPDDLHRLREAIEPIDVVDVFLTELRERASVKRVELLGELAKARLVGEAWNGLERLRPRADGLDAGIDQTGFGVHGARVPWSGKTLSRVGSIGT